MLIKRSIHTEIKSLIFTKWYVLCTTLLQNLFFFFSFQESIVCLSSLLDYREGTYGEHFWTINQILVHQSNLYNVNTVWKNKVLFFFFFSISCNIIYWSSCSFFIGSIFIFFSLRISSPDMPSRDIIFLKRMEKHL